MFDGTDLGLREGLFRFARLRTPNGKTTWDALHRDDGAAAGGEPALQDFNHVWGSNNDHNWEADGDMRWDDHGGM